MWANVYRRSTVRIFVVYLSGNLGGAKNPSKYAFNELQITFRFIHLEGAFLGSFSGAYFTLALNMLTETQKIEMPSHFLQLYNAGMIDEALTYLRENWLIYPHLPTWALDDEQISEIAISRHSYLSWRMSERLQRDIRFFEKVFNQFSPYTKIALETGRDTFFLLAYGNAVHGYSKAATKSDVSALFPAQDTDHEYSLAKQLIAETAKWREWHLSDKDECSHLLSEAVPGLASFSYEYAYYWGFRNFANDQRAQFC